MHKARWVDLRDIVLSETGLKRLHTAVKRNKVLIHATTWMTLENLMLSERSEAQKTTVLSASIHMKSRIALSIETEGGLGSLVVVRGWRRGKWGVTA